jgi:hypothetical protein
LRATITRPEFTIQTGTKKPQRTLLMLRIRQVQMEALAQHVFDTFIARMEQTIRSSALEKWATATEVELREFILATIDDAEQYGITAELDVERYLVLAARHGRDFPKQAWALPFFQSNPLAAPSEAMDALVSEATALPN